MKVTPDSNCKRIHLVSSAEFNFFIDIPHEQDRILWSGMCNKQNQSLNSMKAFTLLIAITGLITTSVMSRAAIYTVGSPIVNPDNGYTYYLLSPGSWSDSEAYAQTLGGNLVTISDSAENQWIFNTFFPLVNVPGDPALWIGLYDPVLNDGSGAQHAADFVWADGEPVTYTDWYAGEPNNSGGIEYYTAMRSPLDPNPGTWNDLSDSGGGAAGNVCGVVEVVPEPRAYTFLLVSAALFIVSRRKPLVTE